MLSQVYLGRSPVRGTGIDLHRHAEVSCAFSRFLARLFRLIVR